MLHSAAVDFKGIEIGYNEYNLFEFIMISFRFKIILSSLNFAEFSRNNNIVHNNKRVVMKFISR